MIKNKRLVSIIFVVFIGLSLTSCMSTKNVTYFNNKESLDVALSKHLYDAKIMPKDILQIQVYTMMPEASDPFNLKNTSFLVNNDGTIEYPIIGTVNLGGLTKHEAEELIKSEIRPYMSDSESLVVHVHMTNYKYAVLGAVNRPGMFTAPNEKVNIVEAIAMAGDLTLYALRDRIFLIREDSEGQKEYHQLDINDANIVNSPYYYLQQNDMIYVEPRKTEARNAFYASSTSIWFSLTSMLMSVATFILALSR